MRAKLGCDEIDDTLPIGVVFRLQAKRKKSVTRGTAVPKNPSALLAAHRNGLMPLNGAQVFWNRGGHIFALR